MKCLSCEKPNPEYSFRVLEVHTLHVRDFDGERLIQALGDERIFELCAACVSEEVRASLFPAMRILRRCAGFVGVLAVGAVMSLTLTLSDEMIALRVLGPMCVFVGVSGIFARVKEILARRKVLESMSEPERLKASAWECVLKSAPKKFGDNDITYIPIDEAISLQPEELAVKYDLLPPIAAKVYEVIHKE